MHYVYYYQLNIVCYYCGLHLSLGRPEFGHYAPLLSSRVWFKWFRFGLAFSVFGFFLVSVFFFLVEFFSKGA